MSARTVKQPASGFITDSDIDLTAIPPFRRAKIQRSDIDRDGDIRIVWPYRWQFIHGSRIFDMRTRRCNQDGGQY